MLVQLSIIAAVVYFVRRHRKQQSGGASYASSSKGRIGEELVDAELRSALDWLCPDAYYLHRGGMVLHHAPGAEYPTAEVDHLLVTPFGVFVIETKNWSGLVRTGAEGGQLERVAHDGSVTARKSPIAQNITKVAFVRSVLTPVWNVESLSVFADAETQLDRSLPLNIIRRDEIRHYLRVKADAHARSGKPPVVVNTAVKSILAVSDQTPNALEKHCLRVAQRETRK
jgi:hypothetical protein